MREEEALGGGAGVRLSRLLLVTPAGALWAPWSLQRMRVRERQEGPGESIHSLGSY